MCRKRKDRIEERANSGLKCDLLERYDPGYTGSVRDQRDILGSHNVLTRGKPLQMEENGAPWQRYRNELCIDKTI